jgi:hypothetical protein
MGVRDWLRYFVKQVLKSRIGEPLYITGRKASFDERTGMLFGGNLISQTHWKGIKLKASFPLGIALLAVVLAAHQTG